MQKYQSLIINMLQVKLISLLLIVLLTSSCQAWTYESLNDFPLTLDRGDYIIHATLTDQDSGKKYLMKELIHSAYGKQGKISISHDGGSVDVHYDIGHPSQRLVIKDYDCHLFTYKNKWDKMITDITKPLLNHVLLVGPSLIYRLKHRSLFWQKGYDTKIRGTTMHTAYATTTGSKLNITYYYKSNLDAEEGLSQPSRITLKGQDPSDYRSSMKQNLVLDIYLQTTTNDQLDKLVGVKPGIGCPISFVTGVNYFKLVQESIHFLSIETVNGPTTSSTRNEIYADEQQQIASFKTTSEGTTTEAIYDYNLGLIYKLQENEGCLISPMNLNAPGIYISYATKPLRINYLFDTISICRYLGQNYFENRPGLTSDVWESVLHNSTIKSGTYDKVVRTVYTVDSKNTDTSSGMIPLGVTINAYNKNSNGLYQLVETTKKVYYDFGEKISDEEYENRFRISDCYPDPSDRKILSIQFSCKVGDCIAGSHEYYYDFRAKIKSALTNTGTISAGRIGNIDIAFEGNTTIAYVTFLKIPQISRAFKSTQLYVPLNLLKRSFKSSAQSSTDCLEQNANMATTFEAIAYCRDSSCVRIAKTSDLTDDPKDGTSCTVFYIPFKNLYHYHNEPTLENIKRDIKSRGVAFNLFLKNEYIQYTVSRVDEVNEAESESRQLFIMENRLSKFVLDDSETIMLTRADNFADCYRACANFDANQCETFSFCQSAEKTECLLSTSIYANVTDKRVYDINCNIYRKNHLDDFIRINNRAFVNPTSVSTEHWTADCADICYNSTECNSFEFCGGKCRLGGYYTDSTTEYNPDCAIFIPKVLQKYTRTGPKIVIETYHTELSLTLDQCAALCYETVTSDGVCISFNFCPKGLTSSSCSLSKYSVKDSSVKTIDSDICTNYELTEVQSRTNGKRKVNPSEWQVNEGTSGGAATGIIMLFIVVGLTVGLTGPIVYNKTKSLLINSSSSQNETSFNYNRHMDELAEQSSI